MLSQGCKLHFRPFRPSFSWGFSSCANCPLPGLSCVTSRWAIPEWIREFGSLASISSPGHQLFCRAYEWLLPSSYPGLRAASSRRDKVCLLRVPWTEPLPSRIMSTEDKKNRCSRKITKHHKTLHLESLDTFLNLWIHSWFLQMNA